MRTVVVMLLTTLLLAPVMQDAGAFTLRIEDDPRIVAETGRIVVEHGPTFVGVTFGTEGSPGRPTIRSYLIRPLGHLEDHGTLWLEGLADLTIISIIEFNDTNGNGLLDAAPDGADPGDLEGEEIVTAVDLAREWRATPVVEREVDGCRTWVFSLIAEDIGTHGGNGTLERLELAFNISGREEVREVNVTGLSLTMDGDDRNVAANGNVSTLFDVVDLSVSVSINVSGWDSPGDMSRNGFLLLCAYVLGERPADGSPEWLDMDLVGGIDADARLVMDVPDDDPVTLERQTRIDGPFPIGHQIDAVSNMTGIPDPWPISGIGWWPRRIGSSPDVGGEVLAFDGNLSIERSGSLCTAMALTFGPILRSPINRTITFEAMSYLEPEEEAGIELGSAFYLPVIFIITIVTATVVVVHYRRDVP